MKSYGSGENYNLAEAMTKIETPPEFVIEIGKKFYIIK